jgi:predicted RNase H-related nuclease YkuK (DUF458 family)
MFDEAKKAIRESSKSSSIYIGADSIRYKKNGNWWAKYAIVIVLHQDSKRGCKLFHSYVDMQDFGSIKQRLLNEVMYAIEATYAVVDDVESRHLELHIDINPSPRHKSNVALKEALGWVKGSLGIDAVIKPNAWAATHAADHLVRRGGGGAV